MPNKSGIGRGLFFSRLLQALRPPSNQPDRGFLYSGFVIMSHFYRSRKA
ncbi:MAG: hypothetical protein LUQ06_06505 [Methylococcaceae bacterium]|nr:hypothetical protein [Methylococcaceae bacterium]MDD1635926.1 hypothetical protein [Methylococcaceae bacterium]